jgi:hypothetical protein
VVTLGNGQAEMIYSYKQNKHTSTKKQNWTEIEIEDQNAYMQTFVGDMYM